MDTTFLGLWFLCGLGTIVFTALHPVTRGSGAIGAAAFLLGAVWSRHPWLPPPMIASTAAIVAAGYLVGRPRPAYAFATAGLLAGVWAGALAGEGVPFMVALVAVAGVVLLSAGFRMRRSDYAPGDVRDEALLFIFLLALVVGAAPLVVDGWNAANNLKLQGEREVAALAVPAWALTVSVAALVSGGVYSLWSRR